jgi:hypothetical protein
MKASSSAARKAAQPARRRANERKEAELAAEEHADYQLPVSERRPHLVPGGRGPDVCGDNAHAASAAAPVGSVRGGTEQLAESGV